MLRNYLKIALRALSRNRGYALINILGLTIGITCSCLLFLFINDELSYDGFHRQSDNLFRVVEVVLEGDDQRYFGQTAPAVAEALVKDYPDVVAATRLFRPIGHLDTEWKGERLQEREYFMVESNFFELFDFELVKGDAATAVASANSVVMTEATARKYFGDEDPMGEVIQFQNLDDATITGIVKDLPSNSHLQFDLLITGNPSDSSFLQFSQNWSTYGAPTYVLLDHPDHAGPLQAKSKDFARRYWAEAPNRSELQIQNIKDIYYGSSDIEFGVEEVKGEKRYVYLFGAIAIFLLLIACINYINLATVKSAQRAREIGVRKVSGAMRWQLITQFFSESMVIALISFVLSLGLVNILIPYFNQISGKDFLFNLQTLGDLSLMLLAITLVIGLFSGLYPALYLSKLRPSESLKGEVRSAKGALYFRQSLVVAQFSLSIIMIIATIVTNNQMDYIQDRNMGFDLDVMAVIDINNGNVRSSFETMKYEFSQVPGVESVAASSRVPGEWKNIVQQYVTSDNLLGDSLQAYFMSFDEHMIDTYGMEIKDGKNFSGNRLQDSTTVLINRQAAEDMGWDEPVGKNINIAQVGDFKVAGVVKDFHFQSLHEDIAPLVIGPWSNVIQSVDYFSLKLSNKNISETVAGLKSIHEKFDDSTPMELHFLDQQLDLFYQADKRAQTLFSIGALLTIFIACLGLFGLASFIIQKRTKELSVRKVLGATIMNLLIHISKSFARQIIIAFVIAAPIAWWVMKNWLGYFAYHVEVGPEVYLYALGLALLVGLTTVGYRALKAAMLNPAHSLKNE